MPEVDGFAVAQAAKQMRKELKVIILSGRESDGRGFPLVRKPFLLSDLTRTMAATGRIAVRAAIGEALRSRSEVPQHLPHEMLALLMQMKLYEDDGRGTFT
jgi:hypothetical protein